MVPNGIFDPFFPQKNSAKFTVNVPNWMKAVKLRGWVGGFTTFGQLSQFFIFSYCIIYYDLKKKH